LKQKKSIFIKPLVILLDIVGINLMIYIVNDFNFYNLLFITYISVFWLFIAYYTDYYSVYRYTHISKIIYYILSQSFIFSLAYLSYFSIFKEGFVVNNQLLILLLILATVITLKFITFFSLKIYRLEGKSYRNIILFGDTKSAKILARLFNNKEDLGYRFKGFFTENKTNSKLFIGNIDKGFDYILKNDIDEIYCSPSAIENSKYLKIQKFVKKNDLELKIVPETTAIYSKDFTLDYIGTIPVLKPKLLPFEKVETHIAKRSFDIILSLIIFICILSWLIPILAIFIRLDSKGGVFFKQKRDGIDGKSFDCYKLRSMKINKEANILSATKNDSRITNFGKFLRKTSLDELPQFFNVLIGDMSIVGPRPHINLQTKKYTKEIKNYLIRNSVRPGITGLAQISGYRGEVIKRSDIENRVRLDIFYIENWSLFLDVKIIFQTFLNFFKKEEKAY
jgi:putative colanic acid biosynthesis UDP-glucose lipid carrier transferase